MERSGERSYSRIILSSLCYSLAIQTEMNAAVEENKKMKLLKIAWNGKSKLINLISLWPMMVMT